jgi:hypothetical protein
MSNKSALFSKACSTLANCTTYDSFVEVCAEDPSISEWSEIIDSEGETLECQSTSSCKYERGLFEFLFRFKKEIKSWGHHNSNQLIEWCCVVETEGF